MAGSGSERRVSLDGDLRIELDPDHALDIVATGNTIRVDVASLGAIRPTRRLIVSGFRLFRRLSRVLGRRGLTLTITRGTTVVARAGRAGDASLRIALFRLARSRFAKRRGTALDDRVRDATASHESDA